MEIIELAFRCFKEQMTLADEHGNGDTFVVTTKEVILCIFGVYNWCRKGFILQKRNLL